MSKTKSPLLSKTTEVINKLYNQYEKYQLCNKVSRQWYIINNYII